MSYLSYKFRGEVIRVENADAILPGALVLVTVRLAGGFEVTMPWGLAEPPPLDSKCMVSIERVP